MMNGRGAAQSSRRLICRCWCCPHNIHPQAIGLPSGYSDIREMGPPVHDDLKFRRARWEGCIAFQPDAGAAGVG